MNGLNNNTVEYGHVTGQDDYKLKLIPKKLKSGRCQVKFIAGLPGRKSFYGYALTEPNDTLRGVVENITKKLKGICSHTDFRHQHLYALQRTSPETDDIIIFET